MLQHSLTNPGGIEHGASRAPQGQAAKEQDERLTTLQALLLNPDFRASERNKRFLAFVIEETIAGRSDRIKAFTIAVDVFGRDADFDATVDPIVRIAAGQLRKSLNAYYSGSGRLDRVRIGLPLGGYVPTFTRTSRASVARQRLRNILWSKGAMAAGLSLVVAAVAGYGISHLIPFSPLQASAGIGNAVMILDSARSNDGSPSEIRFAQTLTEALWVQMGRQDGIRLVGVRADEELDRIVSQARQAFSNREHMYQLLTTVQVEAEKVSVFWHLVDADSRETYYSSRVSQDVTSEARNAAADTIAANMAASLFGYDGFLSQYAEGARILANDTSR
ncbi:hypothetical protein [Nitratireductor pacificus]|nr:hypothetical protein [Nitratireductor pacificus]